MKTQYPSFLDDSIAQWTIKFSDDEIIYAVFCDEGTADVLYECIKTNRLMFIVLRYKADEETDIFNFYKNRRDVEIIILNIDRQENHSYRCLFLIKAISTFKRSLLYYAERRLKNSVPAMYRYAFTYRSQCNAYRMFPVYQKAASLKKNHKVAVILVNRGYGDAVILYPLIQIFVEKKKQCGYMVHVYHSYYQSKNLAPVFLPNTPQYTYPYVDNRNKWSDIKDNIFDNYEEIYDFAQMIIGSSFTYLEEAARFLNISFGLDMLESLQLHISHKEEIGTILDNYRLNYKHIIGVQFHTEDDHLDDISREWGEENCLEFLRICGENSIGVVNLAPCPFTLPDWVFHADTYDMSDIFTVTSKLDATVTIDSCCGHIAAVMGIPNVVLLGTVLPRQSQQTLRKNLTLLSHTGRVGDIQAREVFTYLMKIINNNLPLRNQMKKRYDFTEDIVVI